MKIKSTRKSTIGLISLFLIIPVLVIIFAVFKFITSKTVTLYAKVKVSQGLWWASTSRPNYWFVESFKIGEQEKSLSGNPSVELLGFSYYPHISRLLDGTIVNPETTYNIYLRVKLGVKNTKEGKYIFKRSPIAVGSPIEIEFPSVQLTGTVIKLSEELIKDEYVTKIIHLIGDTNEAWRGQVIRAGDSYFDGSQEVFRVLDKKTRTGPGSRNEVEVKAQILLRKAEGNKLFFGEEQEIIIGAPFELSTQKADYSFLRFAKVE